MNPSSTIKASGLAGALTTLGIILLAVLAPTYYARLPPGSGETLVVLVSTIAGYFKKETVLNGTKKAPAKKGAKKKLP